MICHIYFLFSILDCGNAAAAAHPFGEGDYGRGQLRFHSQIVQNVQGSQVPLHVDGGLPRRRALDHP